MHLYIGNKLYSSWSLRPWILMRELGLQFEDTVIPLNVETTAAAIAKVSGAGKVPILVDGEQTIWDSLAIAEYLQDKFPDKPVWPTSPQARAHARCLSAEMHSSFTALRGACPMNLGKRYARADRGADVAADATRIEHLWIEARQKFGQNTASTFLYGEFCAADAMYAPVVTRLDTYDIPVSDQARAYMDAVLNHPAFVEWREAALKETWVIEQDEVDEVAIENFRPHLP